VPPPVIIDEPDPEPTRVESRTSDDYQVDKVKDDEPSVDLDTDGRSGGALSIFRTSIYFYESSILCICLYERKP
jgi:hypothetical protein